MSVYLIVYPSTCLHASDCVRVCNFYLWTYDTCWSMQVLPPMRLLHVGCVFQEFNQMEHKWHEVRLWYRASKDYGVEALDSRTPSMKTRHQSSANILTEPVQPTELCKAKRSTQSSAHRVILDRPLPGGKMQLAFVSNVLVGSCCIVRAQVIMVSCWITWEFRVDTCFRHIGWFFVDLWVSTNVESIQEKSWRVAGG